MTLQWYGPEVVRDARAAASNGIAAAAITLQTQIMANLSRPGAPSSATAAKTLVRGNKILAAARGAKLRRGLSKTGREAARYAYARQRIGGLVDPPGGFPRVRSGNLRRSISIDHKPGELTARVGPSSSVPYARIQEYGGRVTPKSRKYLSWVDAASGKRIFAKAVNIPARPYVRPALVQARGAMVDAFAAELRRAFL